MAYWNTEEAKEREMLYRLHSSARTAVSEGGEASTSNCQHVEDTNCSLGLANRSEEEKEEVRVFRGKGKLCFDCACGRTMRGSAESGPPLEEDVVLE